MRTPSAPGTWARPSAPRFDEFEPLAPGQLADPYPLLARARREVPVFYMPAEEMWCVTRHADVLAVMKDTKTFSNFGADAVVAPKPPGYAHVQPRGNPVSNSLHNLDPPQHTRVRRLAQKAFTKRHAELREDEIRATADGLIDRFEGRAEVDLVEVYSSQIPASVIAPIVGAPLEVAPQLKAWIDDWFVMAGNRHLPEERNAELWESAIAFETFIRELVAERRARPTDDLTSDLVRATSDDGSPSLSDDEIVAVISGLIAAGADTTNVLVANAMDALLSNLEQWEQVRNDHSLITNALEETLRLRCPVRGLRRLTTIDTEIAGVPIPAGSVVFLHAGSANRDESVFENPDAFDLHRPNVGDHLGLGVGIHFCLGAPLARVESRVAIERLAVRLPNLRRVPGQVLEWSPSTYVPGLLALRVTL